MSSSSSTLAGSASVAAQLIAAQLTVGTRGRDGAGRQAARRPVPPPASPARFNAVPPV
jgi:hypothetical protein